ncbi:two-component regulator propeller domain-containing protein [Candidatus Parabeggiatoa sp. HSG14]|uniref:two-component regulator propeller domain-containing protein n=1 Tax=Candidatus Parabeggiatoa sp. HSG14 TaxID=3055593 RepID=UPI0025A6A9A8|nr:two-component regulator propeller domain-containing protein [Thiotrichales bacterium HSG14]
MQKQLFPLNRLNSLLLVLLWLFMLPRVGAAELVFSPATPTVVVGQQITLSVSGTNGEITWTPSKGQIQGAGNQVIYIAPPEAGLDVVTAFDSEDNVGTVKVIVTRKQLVSLENANWEVFTNRSEIRATLLSDDGKTLWVGTTSGLEQRGASTGELVRVFTNLDGLPDNYITTLENDGSGGLWIGIDGNGTNKGGLAYHSASGKWTVYNEDNSGLPDNWVTALKSDGSGGLWIGTMGILESGGLAYRSVDGEWTVYTTDNSMLPNHDIEALETDGNGGLWIKTEGSLAYRSTNNEWTVYNPDNLKIPFNDVNVNSLESDSSSGLWIGTFSGGLIYFSVSGEGTVYTTNNSELPDNWVFALESDSSGGLWIGTLGGLAYRSINGEWKVYNQDNSELPDNWVFALEIDNNGGLWIGTYGDGLAYHNISGEWTVYTTNNSGLPGNTIDALENDGSGGLWIGTWGLAYRSVIGKWTVYTTDNSGLTSNIIKALESDDNGGLWIGTNRQWYKKENNYIPIGGGLVYHSVTGEWTVYTTDNSGLTSNNIEALESDGSGGLWIGTTRHRKWNEEEYNYIEGGLAYRGINGEWTVYTTDNSGLPNNKINALESDGSGELWVGTDGGLVYRNVSGEWTVYNEDNSVLPNNYIIALESDSSGGLWIGTGSGLAYHSVNGEWTVYTKDNSRLPSNSVRELLHGSSGLWIGTNSGGLAYRNVSGEWTVYTTDNSGLPSKGIDALLRDGSGGLWIGTNGGGLAHLNFGQKTSLVQTIEDETARTELLTGERAAILIHPNGSGSASDQELAVDFMATYAYHSLQARGYDNDEIHFLSYKPDLDFNDDAMVDYSIVDAPVTLAELRDGIKNPRDITVDDIRKAFEWAKAKGKLEQPLIVIFVDHGLPNELILNPLGTETLTADTFKALLDDYQNSINDQKVVVILEACHSGTFVEALSAPNRLIISSTDGEKAYFSDYGRTSFLKLYFDNLRRGKKFGDSLKPITDTIATYIWPLNQQRPQLRGNATMQDLCLNGCWGELPGILTLTPEKLPSIIPLGQPIDFTVYTNTSGISVKKIWASLVTPEIASQRNEQGYSFQPAPFIPFSFLSTNTRKNDEKWQGSFSKFNTPGKYVVTFKAKDNKGFITEAPPVILTVEGKGLTHARFDTTTNILHIPAITVGTDIYQADLLLRQFEPEIILDVDMNSLKLADDTTSVGYSNFTPNTGEVYIPLLKMGNYTYSTKLTLVPETSPIQFLLKPEDLKLQP